MPQYASKLKSNNRLDTVAAYVLCVPGTLLRNLKWRTLSWPAFERLVNYARRLFGVASCDLLVDVNARRANEGQTKSHTLAETTRTCWYHLPRRPPLHGHIHLSSMCVIPPSPSA